MDILKLWEGTILIDGIEVTAIPSSLDLDNISVISLRTKSNVSAGQIAEASDTIYRVTVRQYMTKETLPGASFDFMEKWNKNIPMPLRTMIGTIEKETKGMYYMKLKADTTFDMVDTCMKCGKAISNPVSKYFGMGPECGGHNYTNPFNSNEELNEAVNEYKLQYLSKLTWEGWIIKSAITEMEELE